MSVSSNLNSIQEFFDGTIRGDWQLRSDSIRESFNDNSAVVDFDLVTKSHACSNTAKSIAKTSAYTLGAIPVLALSLAGTALIAGLGLAAACCSGATEPPAERYARANGRVMGVTGAKVSEPGDECADSMCAPLILNKLFYDSLKPFQCSYTETESVRSFRLSKNDFALLKNHVEEKGLFYQPPSSKVSQTTDPLRKKLLEDAS